MKDPRKPFAKHIEEFVELHGDKFDYSLNTNDYYKPNEYIKILCKKHLATHEATVSSHKKGIICPECQFEEGKIGISKLPFKCRIIEMNKTHNNFYDYSNNKKDYYTAIEKISIICPVHGEFFQSINTHMGHSGSGCTKCGQALTGKKRRSSFANFINKANIVHNNEYDYGHLKEEDYVTMQSKVKIKCNIHGFFEQKLQKHLSGQKCKKCVSQKLVLTNEQFIEKANKVHNNEYDYSEVEYISTYDKVKIICKKHGAFYKKPYKHLSGSKCFRCISNASVKEHKWLDTFNIPSEQRNFYINVEGKGFYVDGYQEINGVKTVYEFNGDFWHGNPAVHKSEDTNPKNGKIFGDLLTATLKKKKFLEKNGFVVISIWEKDYDEKNY